LFKLNISFLFFIFTRVPNQALADNYRTRMMEFGFHPGETVSCVQSLAFGAPKVYRVSNTIFSLDEEVASHLLVRLLGENE